MFAPTSKFSEWIKFSCKEGFADCLLLALGESSLLLKKAFFYSFYKEKLLIFDGWVCRYKIDCDGEIFGEIFGEATGEFALEAFGVIKGDSAGECASVCKYYNF